MPVEELKTKEEEQEYRQQVMAEMWGEGSPEKEQDLPELPDHTEKAEDAKKEEVVERKEDNAEEPDAVMKRFDDITQKLQALENLEFRMKQAEKRVGSLQNAVQNPPKPQPETKAPSKEEIAAAAEDDKAWATLKESYPEYEDMLDAIEKRFGGQQGLKDFENRLSEEREKLKTDFDSRLSQQQIQTEVKFVTYAHPDWQTIKDSPDYQQWLTSQNLETQHIARNSNDALEVIDILNRYKDSRQTAQDEGLDPAAIKRERNQRLGRAVEPKKSGKQSKSKALDDMTDAEVREQAKRKYWGTD